ncbi:10938_t:CDS:2 [Funneliformis geosporum]|nr:10938_t:CDS:2 [Funneliformis geosporum]
MDNQQGGFGLLPAKQKVKIMNRPTETNLFYKLTLKNIRPRPKRGGDADWLSVRYHLPNGVRINPDFSVNKSFPRCPSGPTRAPEQKYRERKSYEQIRLLERVKKLEQAVEEIWGNCECVRKRTKAEEQYSASTCGGCGHSYGLCICEPEELREHECDRECPTAPCVICDGARGGRAKTVSEIVYEEAIPIDQEFLAREQFNFRDLVDRIFEEEGSLWEAKREAEELLAQKDKKGVKVWSKDGQWFLYINLVKPREDVHSLALEERINPSLRNWDEFMVARPRKYAIMYAIQDFYFCEVGERKVHKKYALMHFTRNQKETAQDLVNFCFDYEEVAKSKLKNCRLRDKGELIRK